MEPFQKSAEVSSNPPHLAIDGLALPVPPSSLETPPFTQPQFPTKTKMLDIIVGNVMQHAIVWALVRDVEGKFWERPKKMENSSRQVQVCGMEGVGNVQCAKREGGMGWRCWWVWMAVRVARGALIGREGSKGWKRW